MLILRFLLDQKKLNLIATVPPAEKNEQFSYNSSPQDKACILMPSKCYLP